MEADFDRQSAVTNLVRSLGSGLWQGVRLIAALWLSIVFVIGSIAFPQSSPAPALTMSASKSEVASGKTTRLSWFGTAIDRCEASGAWSGVYEGRSALKGSYTTPPLTSRDSLFVLTCTGPGGSASARVTVQALPKPEVTLTASPESLTPGQSVQLRWTSVDASGCKASGSGFSGQKDLVGQETLQGLTKGKKKFSLSCKGVAGTTKATAEVVVVPVPTLTFSARKEEIAEGQSAQLKWRAKDATRCQASGDWSGDQSLSGSFTSAPLVTTQTYTLRCEGANGLASETVTVRVIPAPVISFALDQSSIVEGDPVLVTWSGSNATSCKASGAWKGGKSVSGTELVEGLRSGAKKFTLQCQGSGGKTSETQLLSVLKRPVLKFRTSKTEVDRGASIKLSWSAKNVDACEANGAWSGPQALSGSYTTPSFNRNGQYRFTLTCSGVAGLITESVVVRVGSGFPDLVFEATPSTVRPGERVNLRWESNEATQCTASGAWQGSRAIRGSQNFLLTQVGQYAFTLTCENALGSSEETVIVTVDSLQYSVSASEVRFDSLFSGTQSEAVEVVLRNRSRAPIDIRSVGITGADSSQFAIETDCDAVIAVAGICRSLVSFAPSSPGIKNAVLRFSTSGDPGITDVRLTGESIASTVGFSLIVPSFIQTDSDVNDPFASYLSNDSAGVAQFLTWPFAVGGFVARAGASIPGATLIRADGLDYFRVRLATNQAVILEVAEETGFEDLDIYLFTVDGVLVDSSVAPAGVAREVVSAPTTDEYIIVVQAFAGGAKYLLVSDSSTTSASAGRSLLSMDFRVGQVVTALSREAQGRLGRDETRSRNVVTLSAPTEVGAIGLNVLSGELDSVFTATLPAEKVTLPHGRFRDIDQQRKFETLWAIKTLKASPELAYVEPDFIASATVEPNDPEYARQKWHYDVIQGPAAWDIFKGSDDVVVAVIDSGVARHPDLVENLLGGYDFVSRDPDGDGDGRDSDPADPGIIRSGSSIRDSHGTHVAGTIAARGNNALGVTGVAWRTKILPIRALDATGRGSTSDIVAAMRYAADLGPLRPPRKAQVINLSLGSDSSTCSNAYQQVIDEVRAAGVIVVAAAGNSSLPFVGSPANCRGVIAVSALGPQKQLSGYSNFGSAVDVAAPGGDGPAAVFSTQIRRENDGPISFNYAGSRGTSMATPHVAGVIALMKGVRPELTPESLDALIVSGGIADDIGEAGKDALYGYGALNAVRAINASKEPLPTTAPFEAFFSPGRLDFGDTVSQIVVTVTLTGDTSAFERFDVRGPTAFLDLVSVSRVDANTSAVVFSVRRDVLPIGSTTSSLTFEAVLGTGNRQYSLPLTVTRNPTTYTGDGGAMYAILFDPILRETVGGSLVDAVGPRAVGEIEVEKPGDYWLVIGSDTDNDFFICGLGEACAAYPISSGLWQTISVLGNVRGFSVEATYLNRLTADGAQLATVSGLNQAHRRGIPRQVGQRAPDENGLYRSMSWDAQNVSPTVKYRFLDLQSVDSKKMSNADDAVGDMQAPSVTSIDESSVTIADKKALELAPQEITATALHQGDEIVLKSDRRPIDHLSYRIKNDTTDWGVQHWVLESLGTDGQVQARVPLPDTTSVVWRHNERHSITLPSAGWAMSCGQSIYSLIDGYGLTVTRHDFALLRAEHQTLAIRDTNEAVLIHGLECREGRLEVSGVSLPVSSSMPSLSEASTEAKYFSLFLRDQPDAVFDVNDVVLTPAEGFEPMKMCVRPPAERWEFCREFSSVFNRDLRLPVE